MTTTRSITIELPASPTVWVQTEAERRATSESEVVRDAVEAAAERRRRVAAATDEIVKKNAEFYRRLEAASDTPATKFELAKRRAFDKNAEVLRRWAEDA